MLNILARIKAEPWAITPKYMETILDIAQRNNNTTPEQVAQQLGRPLENSYNVETRDGVAILPVSGPLFRYANLFTSLSGATSYQMLARDFHTAIEDPNVKAVLLNIDSPGGEANGVSEFAEQIFQARGKKKIVAYVGGTGASAAYWIASAADEIIIDETASLGSIGTVLGVTDTRERDEKNGVKRLEIVSTQSPYKRVDPTTDEGQARLQSWVDQLSDVFIDKVARNRGYSRETVMSDFGQGDIMIGKAAVEAGMANRLGSFEGTLSYLAGRSSGQGSNSLSFKGASQNRAAEFSATKDPTGKPAGANHEEKETGSMDLEKLKAEHPELYKSVHAEGKQAGIEEGKQAGMDAGTKQERERIQSIEDMAMTGHEEIIKKAKFETGISAEQLAVELIKAEKQRKANFLEDREADAGDLSNLGDQSLSSQDHGKGAKDKAKAAAEEEERNTAVAAAARGFNARSGHKTVK